MSDYEREMAKLSEVAAWTPEQQAEAAAAILAAGGLAADLEAALAADPSLLHDCADCAVCDTNPGPCSCNAGARYAALVTAAIADLLAEVRRLSEENGRLRERIEAALEIDSKLMVGFLADIDFAAGIADGFNDCRSKFRSVLVPGEAGKE